MLPIPPTDGPPAPPPLDEVDKRNLPVKELMKQVAQDVISQWEKANHLFKPPVICTQKSLERRLETEWNRAKLAARNRLSKADKPDFENKLDSLLDLLR